MYTVILKHDGIERRYPCEGGFDAVTLFDALSRIFSYVEMWQGKTLIQKYEVK